MNDKESLKGVVFIWLVVIWWLVAFINVECTTVESYDGIWFVVWLVVTVGLFVGMAVALDKGELD